MIRLHISYDKEMSISFTERALPNWAGTSARIMPSIAVDVRKGIDESEAHERPIYLLHQLSEETGLVSQARMVDASI